MRKMVNVFRNAALLTTVCSGVSSLVFAIAYMIYDDTKMFLPEGRYTLVEFIERMTVKAATLNDIAYYTRVLVVVFVFATAIYVISEIAKFYMDEKKEAQV